MEKNNQFELSVEELFKIIWEGKFFVLFCLTISIFMIFILHTTTYVYKVYLQLHQ